MKKLIGLFVFLLIVGTQIVTAQSKQISGTVTSADDGLGMPGVSVVIKGTTIGASTDIDGKYNLEASASDVLVFSFVGMVPQNITVGSQSVINIVMETESIGMDEVIVTAIGVSRSQKSLGYAATSVGGEDLTKAAPMSALGGIQGKVAGVNIWHSVRLLNLKLGGYAQVSSPLAEQSTSGSLSQRPLVFKSVLHLCV